MAASKLVAGARVKMGMLDPKTGVAKYVGIWNNVSFGLTYDTQPIYTLGAYGPVGIEYTAQEPVNITCSGWRVIDHGAHVEGMVPNLLDLINHEYLTLTLIDRQNPTRNLNTFRNVRPTGYSTTISARNIEEITVTFVGTLVDDESTRNTETDTASQLP